MAPDGYAWWYVDALSDDGSLGLTLIAFIGSVFSPYYARARRRGPADPLAHCALNVALYGRGRWAMTERGRGSLHRTDASLTIGPSVLAWDGTALTIDIDEITAPLPSRIQGRVRVHPTAMTGRAFSLDAARRHHWWPIAPSARVEVALQSPALSWSGPGYLDSNAGEEPLEQAFSLWNWSRVPLKRGAGVLYEVERRIGGGHCIAVRVAPDGVVEDMDPPAPVALPPTRWWRMPRATRADASDAAAVLKTLEDAPFYSRSVVAARLFGEPATGVHESLSLDRFRAGWVQALLPFRMPRALWSGSHSANEPLLRSRDIS